MKAKYGNKNFGKANFMKQYDMSRFVTNLQPKNEYSGSIQNVPPQDLPWHIHQTNIPKYGNVGGSRTIRASQS